MNVVVLFSFDTKPLIIIIYLYITTTFIMYVCSRNTAKTVHDRAKILGPPYSSFTCGVQYQVSLKSGNEKIIKNQFPIQSSTVQENLINANNLSGIVRWSYLFFFSFFEIFFLSTAVITGTQRVHGSSRCG